MDYLQYSQDFQINSYFNALPPYVRQIILDAYGEISTLGELKECADIVAYLDKKMLSINESVKEFAEKDSTRDEYLDDYTSPVLDLEPISYIIEDSGSNNTDGKEKKKKRWKAGGR